MNMNPLALMQMKSMFEKFRNRHPKFIQFFGYAGSSVTEGSIVEVSITDAEGKKIVTNIRVDREDLELFAQLKNLVG